MNGTITNQFTVWCGVCERWEYLSSTKLKPAHQEAKEIGWRLTKKYGWLCPKHAGTLLHCNKYKSPGCVAYDGNDYHYPPCQGRDDLKCFVTKDDLI